MTNPRWFDPEAIAAAGNIRAVEQMQEAGFVALRPTSAALQDGELPRQGVRRRQARRVLPRSTPGPATTSPSRPRPTSVHIQELYQENRLVYAGEHAIAGRRVDLGAIDCPLPHGGHRSRRDPSRRRAATAPWPIAPPRRAARRSSSPAGHVGAVVGATRPANHALSGARPLLLAPLGEASAAPSTTLLGDIAMQHDDTLAWWREPTSGPWASFGAAWIGGVLDAFDVTVFLLVLPLIAKEFGVSYTATASSITLTLLVRLLGGAVAGWAADRWGRKLPLMILGRPGSRSATASSASRRRSRGCSSSGRSSASGWAPSGRAARPSRWRTGRRGAAASPRASFEGSWASSAYSARGRRAAAVVVPHFGWRALFILAAVPALLAFPIRAWVPESAEWKRGIPRRGAKATTWSSMFKSKWQPSRNASPGRRSRWRRALAATTRSPVSTRRSSSKSTAST